METIKLLWNSDSPFLNTGFSSQSLFLMNGLAKRGYEIDYLGHSYMGQTLNRGCVKLSDGTPFDFTLHGQNKEMYCKDIIIPKINQIKPDIFGCLLDTFMLYPWYLGNDYSPALTTWWFPSDGGGGLPLGCENIINKVNFPVAMAKFGQRQALSYYGKKVDYIPHGVNTELFKPLSEEEKLANRIKWNLKDKFVVGTVARNQGRKMMDRTIKSFYFFAKLNPNAILLLHTDPYDAAAMFDIINLINKFGLQNRVRFTGMMASKGFTYAQMNEVYNLMDVFMLSTSGEGFGVPIIEAMSAGIPSVVTNYTTTRELLIEDGVCGRPIKLVGTENEEDYYSPRADIEMSNGTLTGNWNVERGVMNVRDCAGEIYQMSKDKEGLIQMSKVAREKALTYYKQEIIVEKWDKLLREKLRCLR